MKIGDFIEVLDDTLRGKVTKINGNSVTMRTPEGFELTFNKSEVIKSESQEVIFPTDNESLQKNIEKPKKFLSKKEKKIPPMEVDLHIHHLVASSKNMTNHEMLTLQIETARRQLEFAIEKRIQRVVFIHGVGEGVLRTELEYLLGRYNVKFYDAEYVKYGTGATEVYIFQNTKNDV
ncbi:Smr/MutS family protein [Capnocytophaga sp.]|uniref:Smr/MutS family protein n=1 Tax=Capnocytophaga sp. TaxID=44737 RepID=UPI0026DB1280|nr:Smr/MutS family protein [Capnocytophaga sp.]MDO5105193.1 DNA mismatch repair protein MutS [Capnocytophaga sp.]